MPADGRYNSLGRFKGTIRMGSFMRVTFLLALGVTFSSVVFFETRFTGHLRPSSLSRIGISALGTDRRRYSRRSRAAPPSRSLTPTLFISFTFRRELQ
jgi:hypothetical protein